MERILMVVFENDAKAYEGARARIARFTGADARKIEGDGNAAQAIVDFLAEKRLV